MQIWINYIVFIKTNQNDWSITFEVDKTVWYCMVKFPTLKYFAGKMALWNKVVSGFNKEEETVNFGTRTIVENNGSLYETSTIATIQSNGRVLYSFI